MIFYQEQLNEDSLEEKKCYNGIMHIIMVDKGLSFGNFNYEDINFNRNISMYLVIFTKTCDILESLKCLSQMNNFAF